MPVSPEYKKHFNMLLEYNIKKGVQLDNDSNGKPLYVKEDEEANLDELPPTDIEDAPVEFENTEEINKLDKTEEEKELAKEDDVDRIKKIQDMQTEKLTEIESYLLSLESSIDDLKLRTADVDAVKDNLDILKDKVKSITPYTPEQSLESMPKISGGISVQDYWNNYLNNTDPMKIGVEDEDTNEVPFEKYEVPVSELKGNTMDVKDSFYDYK